ncbi:hypothetical protein SAMN05216350_104162 [Polaromonas sp. YR568]|uniref:hypothetical protein n=1 Tax=Polaromonas sp. YR568 TaxID=1855301 RepID=UPI0008EF03FA|nr:hypothetical protein [Polaromonas sp. YR568]SFU72162.1 hypothetical protein SAMN05216350_104162 [Polaromonas sp. YR568]
MTKFSMKSIPVAAAMAAALLVGAQVHAQTDTATPPGSTKAQDQVKAAPMGGTPTTPEARTAAKAERAAARAEKREKRAAKRAKNSAARDAAATSTGGAQGPAAGGTK